MGFLTDEENLSLAISRMILHVVGEEDFQPTPERPLEHTPFFLERVRDTDVAPVYAFNERSSTKAALETIFNGHEDFEPAAQELSRRFSDLHIGHTKEGAFFIFEMTTDQPETKIYSLIKYDYREAIEQVPGDEGSLLRRIVQAFIADKKAIQKSCLVRVVGGRAEAMISARDRAKSPPLIGDYFEAFLDVKRIRSDRDLNQKAVEVLKDVLQDSKDCLPDGDASRALAVAKALLRDRQRINSEAMADAIFAGAGNPEDEDVRVQIQRRLNRKLRSAKLDGLAFPPDLGVLRRPAMRQVRTTEGVMIRYPDRVENAVVTRRPRDGGGEVFTIETERVTEDRLVGDSTRGAA